MEDADRLLGEALSRIADTPRTHTVTRKQLSNAVERMVDSLDSLPVDAVDWGNRFAEWRSHAQTVADIAQALAQERADPPESELSVWAAALRTCVESHVRDAEILIPWTRWNAKEIARYGPAPSGAGARVDSHRAVSPLRSYARGSP